MRKFISMVIITSLFCMCILAGVGCGQNDKKTDSDATTLANSTIGTNAVETKQENKEPVKISLYVSGGSTDKLLFDTAIPEFYKAFPNIQVEQTIFSGADGMDKIRTAILSGEQIDVISNNGTLEIQQVGEKLYYPLNDMLQKAGVDYKQTFGTYGDGLVKEGNIFGLPRELAPAGLWYNKKQFDAAGIAYPTPEWTWDEFFDIARKLTQKDAKGNVTKYGAFDWALGGTVAADRGIYAAGWEVVDKDGKPDFDDPRFVKMLQLYYKAMVVDKSMPNLADITAQNMHYMYDMYKGKWSMLISSSLTAIFMDIHKMNGQLPKEDDEAGIYDLAYMPRWDANTPVKLSNDAVVSYSVSKGTKYPQEAYDFLYWYCTKCFIDEAKVVHQIPSWRGVDIKTLAENFRYYKDKDENLVQGIDRSKLIEKMLDPEIKLISLQYAPKYTYSTQLMDLCTKHCTLLFAGEKTLEETVQNLQKEALELYEKEKAAQQ